MTFDALDRMVEQNRSGSYTQIVYSPGGGKLALMNGQTLQKAFVPLPGQATAVYTASGLDHYRHSDWLGSARLTSSPSRTYISSLAYAPFGETYAFSGTTDPSFTGMNPDTTGGGATADYDFLYRPYSTQGRWPTPDPAGLASVDPSNPQSWNRYAYALSNPLAYIDPLGLDCIYYTDNYEANYQIVPGECSESDDGYYVDGTVNGIFFNEDGQLVDVTVDGNNAMQPVGSAEGDLNTPGDYGYSNADAGPSDSTLWRYDFLMSLMQGINSGEGVRWALDKGYYSCVAKDVLLGTPAKTKVGEEVVKRTLENPKVGQNLAGAYYHFTDKRFTAWGKYSEVLVPKAAAKIAKFSEKASPYGWLLFEAETGNALRTCTDTLRH